MTILTVTSVDTTSIPNMVVLSFDNPDLREETHGFFPLPAASTGWELLNREVAEEDRIPYLAALSFGLRSKALTSLALPVPRLLWCSMAQHKLACIIGEEAMRRYLREEPLTTITLGAENLATIAKIVDLDDTVARAGFDIFASISGVDLQDLAS